MDPSYIDPSDSRSSRSSSNSTIRAPHPEPHYPSNSINEATNTPLTPQLVQSNYPNSYEHQSSYYSSEAQDTPKTSVASSPALYPGNSLPSQSPFIPNWSFATSTSNHSRDIPLQRIQEVEPEPQNFHHPEHSGLSSSQNNMSALGIQQYDTRLGSAGMRSNYSWPAYPMTDAHYSPQPITSLPTFSEPESMPPYNRALSYSPPAGAIFSPEQRELKRQRDLARRTSKSQVRARRDRSDSYEASQSTTPDIIPRTLPSYSSSDHLRPLHPEQSTSPIPSHGYMPAFQQPPMPSHTSSPEMFQGAFPMPQNEFALNDYSVHYPASGPESSMPLYVHRPPLSTSPSPQLYAPTPYHAPHAIGPHSAPSPSSSTGGSAVRVVQHRPKPQCWEHGCNGRQFSTFSNLLRHQREKSGVAQKSSCPKCGAEFTRTTARNGHMAHEKCKPRRGS